MSGQRLSSSVSQLEPSVRDALLAWVADFDRNWGNGQLEFKLSNLPAKLRPWRVVALSELVRIDVARRWESGEVVLIESYLERFPQLGSSDTIDPDLLMTEWEARQAAGQPLLPDELERRFSQQASAIRQRLRHASQSQVPTFNEASPVASSLDALPGLSDLPSDRSIPNESPAGHESPDPAAKCSSRSVWEGDLIFS